MTNTEYVKANFDLNKVKAMKLGRLELTIFPDEVKKGSILTNPDDGKTFVVVKTPVDTKSLSCAVKEVKDGKAQSKVYQQYAFVGLLVDGKPCKALD